MLAESVHIKTQAFYELYEQYGKDIAEKVVAHHIANGGMSRFEKFPYYHKAFLNIDLSKNDIEKLSNVYSKMVVDTVVEADEVPGATWFLNKYHKVSHYWIVSATPTDEINEIAKRREISEYFIKIYGSPEKKIPIVTNIINEHELVTNETVFLGDAMSDFKAATNNNIDFILRQCNNNYILFREYPEIISFNDFYELEKILVGLS